MQAGLEVGLLIVGLLRLGGVLYKMFCVVIVGYSYGSLEEV